MRDAALRPQLGPLAAKLIQTLQSETPCLSCREGNMPTPGVMLGNGGRIYVDVGNFIENATPEVLRPEEVLTFQRAGELLLLRAMPKAEQAIGLSPGTVSLSRTTTDYACQFCGSHVNIMARRHATSDLVANLLPFLVTRFYAGAGGWSPAGFVMTQKSSAIRCAAKCS